MRVAKSDAWSGAHAYSWGPGGLLEDTGTLYTPGLGYRGAAGDRFYHTDRLGSVRGVSDTQGVYTPTEGFPAFGATSHTAGLFGYAGAWGYQNADGHLGLLYLQQRYYDPEVGRFISPDPIGFAGGLNLYAYCGNDPVNWVDPYGLRRTGSYWGDVGEVFHGYSDLANPFSIYNGLAGLYQIGRECGAGAAASTFGRAFVQGYTAWLTTDDPRAFGQSFGTVMATAGGVAAKFAAPMRAVTPAQGYRGGVAGGPTATPNPVQGLLRVGSGLKVDWEKPVRGSGGQIVKEFPPVARAHGFPDMVDNYAGQASAFNLRPGAILYQLEGSYSGVPGRFEWIVQNGNVTHRMFVHGKGITGVPIR